MVAEVHDSSQSASSRKGGNHVRFNPANPKNRTRKEPRRMRRVPGVRWVHTKSDGRSGRNKLLRWHRGEDWRHGGMFPQGALPSVSSFGL